jgi:hypothetical protein
MEQQTNQLNEQAGLLAVSVLIIEKGGKPAVELRACTTDTEIIKQIVRCAWHNNPATIMPRFTNFPQSLSSLVEKGILYVAPDGEYRFTF